MEENQKPEETGKNREEIYHTCAGHSLMKSLLVGLLIFLGAFCAFYVVSDWHFKNLMRPGFRGYPGQMEHMIKKEMKSMNRMFKKEEGNFLKKTGNIIHLQKEENVYRVIIDLRAFDNNENNVQISANGNILTIAGRSIRKSKNNEQISEFQQNYMFGDNVKLEDLTKETNGNYFIITIPIIENED